MMNFMSDSIDYHMISARCNEDLFRLSIVIYILLLFQQEPVDVYGNPQVSIFVFYLS